MKNFLSVESVKSIDQLIKDAMLMKFNPHGYRDIGRGKTLGLFFMNPSLRTRLSTQKAGMNLGMEVLSANFDGDAWGMETKCGTVMDGKAGEHIKEAAGVAGAYSDIIGFRSFAGLQDREADYSEKILEQFCQYSAKPMVNLESATVHPLQSLADVLTIMELKKKPRPKVVLSWAPHCKALPQAVANSFSEWMGAIDVEFIITHPPGYELSKGFTKNAQVVYSQDEAFKGADFVYVKNWSSYESYGQIINRDSTWMVSKRQMTLTNNAYFMHCLPVRRNLVVADEVLDSPNSVVISQAGNRVYAAQAVLKQILESL